MARRGTLIVFEGADGVGKSTQVRLLARRLRRARIPVAVFSFPRYGTVIGNTLRELLHRSARVWRGLSWQTRALLFAADRVEAATALRAVLREGRVVLLDRYVESNAAYQLSEARTAHERHVRAAWIYRLEYQLLNLPRPDVTILFELAPRLSQRLLRAERKVRDANETLRFQQRLTRAFRESARGQGPHFRISLGDSGGHILAPDAIHERVVRTLVGAGALPRRLLAKRERDRR